MNESNAVNKEKLNKIQLVECKLKAADQNASPEELFNVLIQTIKRYHPSTDISLIKKAFLIAKEAHKDQKRKSGQPYIIHPLSVAIILADLELDKESIAAGILHDVVEDTSITLDYIRTEFGEEIALLVDGVTKLGQLSYNVDKIEMQAENLRKMFLAMAKDIRVILIKLADRLHNMRTLFSMLPEKQIKISKETMDIYAPIAQRLGISKVKVELEDLSLQYLHKDVFEDLKRQISLSERDRTRFVNMIINNVSKHLEEAGIQAEIYGRIKHFFSIYKKMVNQNKKVDEIYDLFAVRIVVDTVMECYAALCVIHEMYKPIPGRFKDYIAMPKQNMYRSLHTTLIGPEGQPFEIQIRTFEMHRTAEYGIAAHWKYKESGGSNINNENKEEAKLTWLREILEWQKDVSDNREFMNLLKDGLDLFAEHVYCFSPKGDVKNLPNGSTPIDFAYSIHSAVGNKMVGAKVNGKLVTIDYKIQNGDIVEILTSQNSRGPSLDWLKLVKSTSAKSKINQWFKAEHKEDNIQRGKALLQQYFKEKAIDPNIYLKQPYMDRALEKYSFRDWDSLLAAIGHGGLKESHVIHKLVEEYEKDNKKELTVDEIINSIEDNNRVKDKNAKSHSSIVVNGSADVSVRFSKCCNPLPGDEIVGFVTRGRGVTIHRTDCINVLNMPSAEKARIIEACWSNQSLEDANINFVGELCIYAKNKAGMMNDITKLLTENNINIAGLTIRNSPKMEASSIYISIEVNGRDQLYKIMDKLRQIEGVIDIERTSG